MNGSIHAWNRGTSNSDSVSAHVLRIRLEIPSGPGALSCFEPLECSHYLRFRNNIWTLGGGRIK